MSMRCSLWSSPSLFGFWLHYYRDANTGLRYLVLESDRSGRTFKLDW